MDLGGGIFSAVDSNVGVELLGHVSSGKTLDFDKAGLDHFESSSLVVTPPSLLNLDGKVFLGES